MRRNVAIEVTRTAYEEFIKELKREGYEVTMEQTGPESELYYVRDPNGADISIAERSNGRCDVYPAAFAAPGGNPTY